MQKFPRLLLLVLSRLIATCSADSKIVISVQVFSLPADIGSLFVTADLGSYHAETEITSNLEAFAFYLPDSAFGRMRLQVQGLGMDGCSTAIGNAEADARPNSLVEVKIEMRSLATKLCPVRIKRQTDPTDSSSLVLSAPAGIHCGDTCTAFFPLNSTIDLDATPRLISKFVGWEGTPTCGMGTRCRVVVAQALALTAQFIDNQITVTPPDSHGRIVSDPPGIECPGTCSARFPGGTLVTLTAQPTTPGKIGQWEGPCLGYTTCQITVSGLVTPSVRFVDNVLTIRPMNGNQARIVSTPPGIDCGTTCSGVFPKGTSVLLSVDSGKSPFVNWSLPCVTGSVCKVTLEQPAQLRVIQASAPACTRGTLCQESPVPFFGSTNSVWSSAAGNVWMVGYNGNIAHWNQDHGERVPSGTTNSLASVHGSAPNNVWAVGAAGTVLRFDGTNWQQVPTGRTNNLSDVWAFSDKDVWVVGTGNALHWDGTTMQTVSNPLLANCSEILGLSPTEIWALGSGAKLVRFDGTTATQIPSPLPAGTFIMGLSGTSPTNIWFTNDLNEVVRYDGTTWQRTKLSDTLSRATMAFSDSDVWVAARPGVLHFDGKSFNRIHSVLTEVQSIWGSAPDNVWMVADFSRVFHWDGQALLEISSGLGSTALSAVSGTSASDVTIYGPYENVFRFDGSRWNRGPAVPLGGINSVFTLSTNEVWAVDQLQKGGLARWDGVTWRPYSIPIAPLDSFYAVGGSSSSDVWVSGQGGDYHFDGTTWTALASTTESSIRSAWRSATGNGLGRLCCGGAPSVIQKGHGCLRFPRLPTAT